MYAYNANPSMYTYLFGRTWPVFLVSSVVVISVTVIVCIVFNSFYAINSSDKLEIAHLRFAQFRKLLHIAIFFLLSLLFSSLFIIYDDGYREIELN